MSKKNINIFPTIVDDNYFFKDLDKRRKLRVQLKIEDKFVFLYVGGNQKWQNLESIVQSFDKASLVDNNIYLIILTTQKESVQNMLLREDILSKNILIDSAKYENVADYINASDLGLLIREKNILNYVARPTKVSEYASCGLKYAISTSCFFSLDGFVEQDYMNLGEISQCHSDIYNEIIQQ